MAKYVRMKDRGKLVRAGIIKLLHVSDDGEYMQFKVLPDGGTLGMWCPGDEPLLVVDDPTVHENLLKAYPQLYEEVENG